MPNRAIHFAHLQPGAGYYRKFGGFPPAISYRDVVACDVVGTSAISVQSWRNNGQSFNDPGTAALRSNRGRRYPIFRPMSATPPRAPDIIIDLAES